MKSFTLFSALVLVGSVASAFWFRKKQNSSQQAWTGGEISYPKCFWLAYAIANWFILPLGVLLWVPLPQSWFQLVAVHTAVWWARGVLELFMIYRWYNWSPTYGILHDVLHLTGLAWGLSWASAQSGPFLGETVSASFLLLATILALGFEAVFASLFMSTRDAGATKVYFASDDPRYRLINRLTLTACVVLYSLWGLQIGVASFR